MSNKKKVQLERGFGMRTNEYTMCKNRNSHDIPYFC